MFDIFSVNKRLKLTIHAVERLYCVLGLKYRKLSQITTSLSKQRFVISFATVTVRNHSLTAHTRRGADKRS